MVGKCILRLPFCTRKHRQVTLSPQGSFCYIIKKKKEKSKNMDALFSGHTASHYHKHSFYLGLDDTHAFQTKFEGLFIPKIKTIF